MPLTPHERQVRYIASGVLEQAGHKGRLDAAQRVAGRRERLHENTGVPDGLLRGVPNGIFWQPKGGKLIWSLFTSAR